MEFLPDIDSFNETLTTKLDEKHNGIKGNTINEFGDEGGADSGMIFNECLGMRNRNKRSSQILLELNEEADATCETLRKLVEELEEEERKHPNESKHVNRDHSENPFAKLKRSRRSFEIV